MTRAARNDLKAAICVLGGSLVRSNGTWRTTRYDERDDFAALGDYVRVAATTLLHKRSPRAVIIASGGKGQLERIPGAPYIADVLMRELMDQGIPRTTIIPETRSGNTYQQLREALQIAHERSITSVAFVTNKYHVPRIRAMLQHAPGLKTATHGLSVDVIDAESIVLAHDPEGWAETIKKAYSETSMKRRINLEREGVSQIIKGSYKFV